MGARRSVSVRTRQILCRMPEIEFKSGMFMFDNMQWVGIFASMTSQLSYSTRSRRFEEVAVGL